MGYMPTYTPNRAALSSPIWTSYLTYLTATYISYKGISPSVVHTNRPSVAVGIIFKYLFQLVATRYHVLFFFFSTIGLQFSQPVGVLSPGVSPCPRPHRAGGFFNIPKHDADAGDDHHSSTDGQDRGSARVNAGSPN